MNPEDDGTELSAVEIAGEMYIGAMQNVCDAVEHWLWVEVSAIDLEPAEVAQQAVADAMHVYEVRRDEMTAASLAAVSEG